MSIDNYYMYRCLELAKNGMGKVAPNPMVGCVIVYEGRVIGEGYHQEYGGAHAEVNAINTVADKELLEKATLYVNLEPCSHFGKTPPCADLIVKHKLTNVIIGCLDTNSLVSGKGIEKLINAGINVKTGVLENECKEINKRFFTYHEKKRPYIILKWAQTKDGFIDADRTEEDIGKALKITNSDSNKVVHKWRSEEQAILVGTNTALLDNPQLTVREVNGKNPLRITIDKYLRIPKTYHLFDKSTPTLVFTNVEEVSVPNLDYIKIDFEKNIIQQIINELYKRNIQSLLVEGGQLLLNSFIESGFWDEARVFISEQTIEKGVNAPVLNTNPLVKEKIGSDKLYIYQNM